MREELCWEAADPSNTAGSSYPGERHRGGLDRWTLEAVTTEQFSFLRPAAVPLRVPQAFRKLCVRGAALCLDTLRNQGETAPLSLGVKRSRQRTAVGSRSTHRTPTRAAAFGWAV